MSTKAIAEAAAMLAGFDEGFSYPETHDDEGRARRAELAEALSTHADDAADFDGLTAQMDALAGVIEALECRALDLRKEVGRLRVLRKSIVDGAR